MSSPNGTDLRPYDQFLTVAMKAADAAKAILNSHFGNLRKVEEKFQAGLVTEADRESEKAIVDILRKSFPDHGILGEEFGRSDTAGVSNQTGPGGPVASAAAEPSHIWMIDPLDGTTNYVHQFPFFCVSIGLEINGELVLGVVDAPQLGSRYYAVKGGGAFKNGEPIHVSKRTEAKDGLFATGFNSYDNTLDEQLEILSKIVKQTRGIRRAGAAALDLCFVAEGVYDAFWEKHLSVWDTAAGVAIAREAGGVATDMHGTEFNPRMKSILVGAPAQHRHALAVMKQIARRKSLD
ncbi:MAG: inositol monophosphatase [Proteobacteria bacterium]|nr:MAG: inositol monophosphatase [Pseudomonadota bacterium]